MKKVFFALIVAICFSACGTRNSADTRETAGILAGRGTIDPALKTPPIGSSDRGDGTYHNPVIWADVPDMSIIRVGDVFWMSSTTMHMSPGVPIMRSYDMVNWEIVSYVYNVLSDANIWNLWTGEHGYSHGSWASALRYRDGTFYLIVPSRMHDRTWRAQIFQTEDPVNQPWRRYELQGRFHDCGLIFCSEGRVWLVYDGGAGRANIIELNSTVTGLAEGARSRVLVSNKFAPHPISGDMPGERTLAEGAQIQRIGDFYFLFIITGGGWPAGQVGSGWMRTVIASRAPSLHTPPDEWESKVIGLDAITGSGVAQGDIIYVGDGCRDTDLENWYGFFFRDSGPLGRLPWLMPVTWVDGWPMLGEGGSHAPISRGGPIPRNVGTGGKSIVTSDEFYNNAARPLFFETPFPIINNNWEQGMYEWNGSSLHLAWQWNHNPDNRLWSLTERPGWLRLTTGYIAANILRAPNTLTQRTFGPNSSAVTRLDVSGMKDGDEAGVVLLTARYGTIGVRKEGGNRYIVTTLANAWSGSGYDGHVIDAGVESARTRLAGNIVYLKAEVSFDANSPTPFNTCGTGRFYYSLDGIHWTRLGEHLTMTFSVANHFMGYRFGLYNFARTEIGGFVDFDFYRISDRLTSDIRPTVLGVDMRNMRVNRRATEVLVPITMDALPVGQHREIVASIYIPDGLSVRNVVFGAGVSDLRFFEVRGNQLLITVTGACTNFRPAGGRGVFATLVLGVDNRSALPLTVSPDVISVRSTGDRHIVYDVRGVSATIR